MRTVRALLIGGLAPASLVIAVAVPAAAADTKGTLAIVDGHWAHEPCWVARTPSAKVPFLGSRDQATIWRARSPKKIISGSEEEKHDHAAQKRVVLAETPSPTTRSPATLSTTPSSARARRSSPPSGCDADSTRWRWTPRCVQVTIERWQAFTGKEARRG